ncbi:hypothetical protein ACET3Z_016157 [Daucus carota]
MTFSNHIFLLLSFVCAATLFSGVESKTKDNLSKGFTVTPDSSVTSFQPLLTDSNANFSLGLLRVNRTQLALVILHLPSSQQLWIARTSRLPRWSPSTHVFFNGSLVISDQHSRVLWSTNTDGDRVYLSNTSNLQINGPDSILWQSFHFPSDTLLENQNFTSNMTLNSSNGLYYMHLGYNFIGLYAKFTPHSGQDQIYYKRKAMEIKAKIVKGQGPIYASVRSDGFLGMYQNETAPIDIQSFSSYQQYNPGNRILKIESDGNLKGYYWTGSNWILDYEAVSEFCELPRSCGAYGLCHPSKGCSCLNNETDFSSGKCEAPENNSGDFCSLRNSKFKILRKSGVELPYKELMEYEKMNTLEQCERSCKESCKCWGAVYSNSSGFCYRIEYPIQTLVSVGDDSKVGYFKVRESAGKSKMAIGLVIGAVLLCGVILVFAWIGVTWRRKRRASRAYVEGDSGVVGVGPYKDLASESFSSIELSERR